MSHRLISRSPDLERLVAEGFDVEVIGGLLVVRDVPYVDSTRTVRRGILVSTLAIAGERTAPPDTHVIEFVGDFPCHADGTTIEQLRNNTLGVERAPGLVVAFAFSNKPAGGYRDYHHKLTNYVALLGGPAEVLEPGATARTFPVYEAKEDESPFQYWDTASTRAGIGALTHRLRVHRVAVVGLGGTGGYVLDLIAKTPIEEIHLFDGDVFSQHNAFRAPGAPTKQELSERPSKVEYFARLYGRMHRRILPHDRFIDTSNAGELAEMAFVFLCLDNGEIKRPIVSALEAAGVPFVDVGMGLELSDGLLGGVLRVATSTASARGHIHTNRRIPFSGTGGDDVYAQNIQVADLNALNAALAVIKWKKLCGFYRDLDRELFCAYTIDGNAITNEDRA